MKKTAFLLIPLLLGIAGLAAQEIELLEPVPPGSVFSVGAKRLRQDRIDMRSGPPVEPKTAAYLWNADPMSGLTDIFTGRNAAAGDTVEIPQNIRNNKFFLESVRLKNLAKSAFEEGDYDGSKAYAEESQRYALLSDEYVANELKRRDAAKAISAARNRISWAMNRGFDKSYPSQYNDARNSYLQAVTYNGNEEWDQAIASANRVLLVLSDNIETLPLPSQYTVRTWLTERDCLWNIAAYPWVYGDPFQWRKLYEANRDKLPEPDNPDLVHPGTVLIIPVARGEQRSGMWQPGRSYTPLPLR
jgi:hypothetical protein